MSVVLSVALLFVSPVAPANPTPGVEGATAARWSVPAQPYLTSPRVWTDTALSLTFDVPPPVEGEGEGSAVEQVAPSHPEPLTDVELVDSIFGWPGRQLVQCESSWNRWAVGPYGERGLLQIHPVHRYGIVAQLGYTFDDMFEVEPNLRVAVEIRRQQGLRAWTCWKGAA